MSIKSKIKSCPSCGAEANLTKYGPGYIVECSMCGRHTDTFNTEDMAMRVWNRKAFRAECDVTVKIKTLEDTLMPVFATSGSACFDAFARTGVTIPCGKIARIPLGICMELPAGWECQVRPRSGLSSKGIEIVLGTVDSDYRGEIEAVVINLSDADYNVFKGDRVCQLAIRRVPRINLESAEELSETDRGTGGFGSTGK